MIVLVTGASGFVGRSVVSTLRAAGHTVRTAGYYSSAVDFRVPLGPDADWSAALAGCDAVVHAGGRAHVLDRAAAGSAATFSDVNVGGTLRLAQAAAAAGVRHFIFISSIAALGERPEPLREDDAPRPTTAYGQSKLGAEQGLLRFSGDMTVTCLRPPLIYGPDAGGRFGQMLRWCARGLPLPFGGLNNQRSYLAVENLADAVRVCLGQREKSAGLFHLADEGTLSTPELLRLIGTGLGKTPRLFAVPPFALQVLRQVGLAQPIDKLSQSLVVDATRFRERLGWVPPVPLREGMVNAARRYHAGVSR
jgi:nucleoside-diphosphate-sugar epimerase